MRLVRISCAPVVLVSFDAVTLVPWIDVVLVLEIDVVSFRTGLFKCSTEFM